MNFSQIKPSIWLKKWGEQPAAGFVNEGVAVKIGSPTVSLIVTSVIGAVVVLFIASLLRKRKR